VGEKPSGEAPGAEPADVFAVRRQKLADLRTAGVEPFPHEYDGVESIARVREAHAGLTAGEETDIAHRVAGRLAARRGQGKMAFLDLVDRSGRIQLQARVDELGPEAMARLLDFDLGDLIGVDGIAFCSRRGELSLRISGYELLAKSLRPPPEKHHGLTDVETRFRHRELDLIANENTRELFITRARAISAIRAYLDGEGFIEVETPMLQPLYGGAAARPFTTHHNALDRELYLRIATELYLKRLIVGGLERVYEIGKNFRNEGLSHKHNPEFTVLEFYEAYADYLDIAKRCEDLVAFVAEAIGYDAAVVAVAAESRDGAEPVDLSAPWRRETLAGSIESRTGIDILRFRQRDALAAEMASRGMTVPADDSWAQLVDELLSKHVEPTLIQPTFLLD
jgi:lysyl-tRNA synthetase, class II